MAFTEEERAQIERLKAEGRSVDEIAAYIGGNRIGSPSTLRQQELKATETPTPPSSLSKLDDLLERLPALILYPLLLQLP